MKGFERRSMIKENVRDPFVSPFQYFDEDRSMFNAFIYTCKFCGASKDLAGEKNVESVLRKHLINCAEFNKGGE